MKIETLQDAYIHELSDIYSAEKQLIKALPKMAKAATDPKLAKAFDDHLGETEIQAERLERVAELCEFKLKREKCDAMAGLIEEGRQIIQEVEEGPVRDAMLIAAAQKVEHYEIASYGCLVALSAKLGFPQAAKILDKTLSEEKATDEKLNMLAERSINDRAMRQAAE